MTQEEIAEVRISALNGSVNCLATLRILDDALAAAEKDAAAWRATAERLRLALALATRELEQHGFKSCVRAVRKLAAAPGYAQP